MSMSVCSGLVQPCKDITELCTVDHSTAATVLRDHSTPTVSQLEVDLVDFPTPLAL